MSGLRSVVGALGARPGREKLAVGAAVAACGDNEEDRTKQGTQPHGHYEDNHDSLG